MIREIGSEFELAETAGRAARAEAPDGGDACFVFSGRTAIETVLRDAGCSGTAALPSYCCASMIEPFRKQGMQVVFYPVREENGLSVRWDEVPEDCGAILACDLFGFGPVRIPGEIADRVRRNGGAVIGDVTHSLLSENGSRPECDYLVGSLRKWFPLLSGGLAVKNRGCFREKPDAEPDEAFSETRYEAMRLKKAYLDRGEGDKQAFLSLYGKANGWLAEHYTGRAMDRRSLEILGGTDRRAVRERRIRNAEALYEGLEGCPGIRTLFPPGAMDCPLFVPVLAEPETRDRLRQALIRGGIYCPVHWPRPEEACRSNLYDTELSLICDQRYDGEDMRRLTDAVRAVLA